MPIGTKNTVIQGCGTHHVAVQARDWEASLRLYRDVLGMNVVAEFEGGGRTIALLDAGDGSYIELFEPTAEMGKTGTVPFMHFALTTTDARAAIEHVRRAGYRVTVEPKNVSLGTLEATIAFFEGPSGEELEFFEVRS